MIFAEPIFRPGGDRFIETELGDEMSFDLNFRVHSVSRLIREGGPAGIVEIVPELTSIMISYDFERISYADVVAEVTALFHAVGRSTGWSSTAASSTCRSAISTPGPARATTITARRSRPRSATRSWWRASTASPISRSSPASIPAPITGWRRWASIPAWSR